jgi:hypothetical protein
MTELDVFQRSLEVSRVTLIITAVLSIASIVFAILSTAFQRSHNKKSVKPLFSLEIEEGKDSLSISICNLGLGPMILASIAFLGPASDSGEGGAASLPLESLPQGERLRRKSEIVLAPGGRLVLLAREGLGPKALDGLRDSLRGISVEVSYEDIYDQRYQRSEVLEF